MSSSELADSVVAHLTKQHEIDDGLRNLIDLFVLDYWGVTVGGLNRDSAQAVREACALSEAPSQLQTARIHGTTLWATPEDAALVNGVTSHGLELDDTHEMGSMHPAVAILPALFAFADSNTVAREEFDQAMVLAYDVMTSIGTYIGAAQSYARGFHPTGICGAIGAAAGVAALMKLDETAARNALSMAANMAAGSLEFLSDGSWTKRLNAGHAAGTGLRAAKLARAGFTAPDTFLEGRDGFLRQYGEGQLPGRELELEFGRGIRDTSIKLYPCCRYTHGNIDLLAEVHDEFPGLGPENVRSLECAVIEAGATLVSVPADRKLIVETSVDAQFNMPFAAAVALTSGTANVAQFDSAPSLAADLLPLMQKVTCITDDRLEAAFPAQWQARVKVTLTDGSVIEKNTSAFKGSPMNPASFADVIAKAAGLVSDDWANQAAKAVVASHGAGVFSSSFLD